MRTGGRAGEATVAAPSQGGCPASANRKSDAILIYPSRDQVKRWLEGL
jgi:hypothetical protein